MPESMWIYLLALLASIMLLVTPDDLYARQESRYVRIVKGLIVQEISFDAI
jgi:hypothetical protein